MGHRGFRKIRCFTAVLLMLILSFCGVCRPVRADSSNRKIMQLYVNKPDITEEMGDCSPEVLATSSEQQRPSIVKNEFNVTQNK